MRPIVFLTLLTTLSVASAQDFPGPRASGVAAGLYDATTGDFFVSANDANFTLRTTQSFQLDAISPPKNGWLLIPGGRQLTAFISDNEVNWYFGNIGSGLGFGGLSFSYWRDILPSRTYRCNENPHLFRCVPEPSWSIVATSAFLVICQRRACPRFCVSRFVSC